MRGSASAYWFLPLGSISYAGLGATLEDEVEKLYVNAFPCGARYPKGANYLTVELAVLKALSQELAELFNLTLPMALKNQTYHAASSIVDGPSRCSGTS
jgi:hypothetical protein